MDKNATPAWTKGPWAKWSDPDDDSQAPSAGESEAPFGACVESGGFTIAQEWFGTDGASSVSREEAEANARLIAAAPCLYEALAAIKTNARSSAASRSKWVQVPSADYHRACAAISKASSPVEGEASRG